MMVKSWKFVYIYIDFKKIFFRKFYKILAKFDLDRFRYTRRDVQVTIIDKVEDRLLAMK